jgi:hypothetical protein
VTSTGGVEVSIVLDRETPPQPFGRYYTLTVPTTSGYVTGRLRDDGIFAACMAGRHDEEACLSDVGRRLRCRVSVN